MTQEQFPTPLSKLDRVSVVNIAAIHDGYVKAAVEVGQFASADEAESAIAQRESEIRGCTALTVNMTGASLDRLLTVGRLETHWDAKSAGVNTSINRKANYPDYDKRRAAADAAFLPFAPTDRGSDQPIYAALASANDKMGAAPEYGSFWIELPDSHADRAVYGFSDSHSSLKSDVNGIYTHNRRTILNQRDALTAKAVTELVGEHTKSLGLKTCGNLALSGVGESLPRFLTVNGLQPGYVEAVVFDPVDLASLKAIHASVWTPGSLNDLGVIFGKHPDMIHTIQVDHVSTDSRLVEEWFQARSGEKNAADMASPLWRELGLPPEANFTQVTVALQKLCALTHRDMSNGNSQYLQMNGVTVASFTNAPRWHNYMNTLRSFAGKRLAADRELADKFITIQQARVFFSANQEFSK